MSSKIIERGGRVPPMEILSTANGQFALCISTNVKKLYGLNTFPCQWTTLNDYDKIVRTNFVAAALQVLDPINLSKFVISSNKKLAWLPPMTGRCETNLHLLEVLQSSLILGASLREAVWANETWVRKIGEQKRPLVEDIVREAGLSATDQSKAIHPNFFGRFFNQLIHVLPWNVKE